MSLTPFPTKNENLLHANRTARRHFSFKACSQKNKKPGITRVPQAFHDCSERLS
jgi:hypothetical protein